MVKKRALCLTVPVQGAMPMHTIIPKAISQQLSMISKLLDLGHLDGFLKVSLCSFIFS